MSISEETKRKLAPSDPRVDNQPSLMPQSLKDTRLGAFPTSSAEDPLTPGKRMEEKYKLMERFCRQNWINHGMIGGGASTVAAVSALWLATKRRTCRISALKNDSSLTKN